MRPTLPACAINRPSSTSEKRAYKKMNFNTFLIMTLSFCLLISSTITPALCDDQDDNDEDLGSDSVINVDGINVNQDLLEETVGDALRSKDEQDRNAHVNSNDKHPFDKSCPYGYFVCDNGECIAPRWRCDGHADCDDYSDELNCTAFDMPQHGLISTTNFTHRLPNITQAHVDSLPAQVYGLEFNSSIEPLMIFSTGQTIRGLWMRSRVYFDVVTRKQVRSDNSAQPSITEAFSLFFGMLGLDPSRSGLASSSSDAGASKSDPEIASKPDNTIVGLDMNPANKEVFWVELGKDPSVYSAVIEDEQFEARHRRQLHGHKKIVEHGLLAPEDIALDTVGRNAYITDAGLPAIVVCSYVHVHCKILVNTKIHKPRAIIADSAIGWIIFTDWGDRPGIFLVSMDGKQRDTLIETDVVWPNGLAQDYSSNFLYWADARLNKIERVDLKTRKRTVLVKEVGTNPFSVSVFENRIYWSDWSGNEIKTCDKESGNNTRNVLRANDIYGIHIYHPDIHKGSESTANPCWSKHCSHLCLLSPSSSSTIGLRRSNSVSATCACPDTMALSILDKATCYEVQLSFLLVNVKNYIAQVFPERIGVRIVEDIVFSKDHAIQDIASDWLHYKLFFFDASKGYIYSADFSGRQTTIQKFTPTGSKSIRGLVYDLQSDNLFWLDPEAGTLTLCSVRGAKFQKILRRNLEHATSMVLDTKNRVFYIALMGSHPRIIRTGMMASEANDVILVDKSEMGLPIALHLDEQAQRLYWADTKYGQIESIEVDVKSRDSGRKPGSRVKHRGRLGTILSFAVYHDYLIWVVQDSDYLYKARKDDRQSRPVPFRLPQAISRDAITSDYRRLITLNPLTETLSSPCYKRGCSHACMMDRDRDIKCICPDGFKLQTVNQSNCIDASKPEPNMVERILRPAVINQLATSGDKHPISGHQIDELTHIRETGGSKDVVAVDQLSSSSHEASAPVSHVKNGEMPHISMDQALAPSSLAHDTQIIAQRQRSEPLGRNDGDAAASTESPVRGNGLVWLITFLVVLTAVGLITVVSLMILNKQGRLSRQMSQLTVSFVSPGSSTGGGLSTRGSGIDKDKTMLLLDTDS